MKVAIGSDHGGFRIKETVKELLSERGLEVEDFGTTDESSVDYPDYAREVASRVSSGQVDEGILVCTTGIGMSIAANKYPGVRAALCLSPDMALKAREHNKANVLVLAGAYLETSGVGDILATWMTEKFDGGRHERRVDKISAHAREAAAFTALLGEDPEIHGVIAGELERERDTIDLIASENYSSSAVREAQGSVLTNKYAEGYPGKRWYNGCEFMDRAENLAIERARELFGAEHANVQPHCGSSANMAVYFAMLQPGDTIMAMSLAHGGHLTHGHNSNFSGRFFKIVGYGVARDTGRLDMDQVAALATQHKPRLIVVGASAYPRTLDFPAFREIAQSVDAYLMVDMAHIAGLVAAGCHPDPVAESDFVTSTTHKTLRGPRSGMILCKKKYAKDIDRQVFPGIQGGPLMHSVAAKAVCFREAMQPAFREYGRQVVSNCKALAEALKADGFTLVSGGTDNHLMLVDLSPDGLTGRDAALALDRAALTVNKNVIPFDERSANVTSGIRIGTAAATTRGMKEPEMKTIAKLIVSILRNMGDESVLAGTREAVKELAGSFPVP